MPPPPPFHAYRAASKVRVYGRLAHPQLLSTPSGTGARCPRAHGGVHTSPSQGLGRGIGRSPGSGASPIHSGGLTHGFRIGLQRGAPLRSAHDNLESARQHPEVIRAYLEKECRLGRMLGPFDTVDHLPPLQVSRFGVIPKGHGTGEWRLITDLSSPRGASVNEGISAKDLQCCGRCVGMGIDSGGHPLHQALLG